MKTLVVSLCIALYSISLAQTGSFVAGADVVADIPLSTLSERYLTAIGGSVYLGKITSVNWTWTGQFDYAKFTTENKDQLFISRTIDVFENNKLIQKKFEIPLPELDMPLEIYGLSANAKYKLYKTGPVELGTEFGFGVFYWEYQRAAHRDSLYADTSGNGGLKLAQVLDLPKNHQQDWSGGLNLGVNLNIYLFGPLSFNVKADYKVIIGELWPALELDMENVSAFQILELKAGIRATF